jgi:hypothetical protein
MSDYKTISDYNIKAQLELIDKQAKLLEQIIQPTILVTHRTLRDQFAMAALTGLVVANYGKKDIDPMDVASWAYGIADAMMGARK